MNLRILQHRSANRSIVDVALRTSFMLLVFTNCALAQNQQTRPGSAIPSDAPPKLQPLPGGDLPGSTIRRPENEKGSVDSRDNSGAVTETRVQTGVSTYYVRPNTQVGSAQPGDAQSFGNRGAQFKVKEFDLGRRKTAKPEDVTPQVLEPAPLPPSLPTKN